MRLTTLNIVVLPAPFGPMSPQIWPSSMVKLRPIEGVDPTEPHRHVLDIEKTHVASLAPRCLSIATR